MTTPRFPINPVQPGAYSVVDASALQRAELTERAPVVAVLGVALGGAPNTALYFSNPGPLRQVLRGGAGYDVARFALAGGARQVAFVRVGSAAQGTIELDGADTNTAITLTSLDYGSWTAGIEVEVQADNKVIISFTDDLGVTYTETYAVGSGATAAEIAAAINGETYGFQRSQYVSAEAGAGTVPLAVVAATALTGGSDGGTPDAAAWTTALEALETEDVDVVCVATGDASVHAQVQTHCDNMSEPLVRKERVAVFGGPLGESVSQQVTRMASLRSRRSQLVYPGIVMFDANGDQETYAPFYAAGLVAGMHAGLADPAFSLLHARVPILDVEVALSSVSGGDLDQLLLAGVTPIAAADGTGFWVVDSLSGYNTDATFRDLHKTRSADFVQKFCRQALNAEFVGKKSLDTTAAAIQVSATSLLDELRNREIIRAYQEASVVEQDARTYLVTLPVMLVDATKFVLLTVALQPTSTLPAAA